MKTRIAGMLVAAAAVAAMADDRPSAKDGFAKIQEAAAKRDAEVLDVVIPGKLVEGRREFGADAVKSWRDGLAKSLAGVKLADARETGDDAVLRLTSSDGELMLPLHFGGTRWVLAAPLLYSTKGRVIDRANGPGPAKVHLGIRTTNAKYGDTAFSFRYVTSEAEKSKNRMSVWFCHNGDLHSVRDGTIADLGATASVDWLPAASAFSRFAHAVPGHTYVVHCFETDGSADFYVKLNVTKTDESGVDFTWKLLATGPGAPADIHKEQPLDPRDNDGADGFDGLCLKSSSPGGPATPGGGKK